MKRKVKILFLLSLLTILFIGPEKLIRFSECLIRTDLPEQYNHDYQMRWDNVSKYCIDAVSSANANDVPWQVVMAIMMEESSGYLDAVSSAGAVGLMGVMPNDAVGYDTNFPDRPTTRELFDTAYNIQIGVLILKENIQYAKNNQDLGRSTLWTAIRMYNGSGEIAQAYADRVCSLSNSLSPFGVIC